ncbi:hypothetical protein MYAM1_001652 [Malassezia yamatoensis]|uniref:Sulfite efflux pump SSU1 n=1 Tax=Malassezia yamatoensis TaxID=253288 RepID=A0AAJ5YYP0_9BASI|nr:hypothetical protein MYAM1_001652 [Malassezia yamatoensis]
MPVDGPGLEHSWGLQHAPPEVQESPSDLESQQVEDVPEPEDTTIPVESKETRLSWGRRVKQEARRITLHFPPSWFTVVMGTTITASLLYTFPYQAQWLHYVAYIVFGLDTVIFALFVIISAVRYLRWPTLFILLLRHAQQSMFLGAFAVALDAFVNLCILVLVPAWGPKFTLFVWALWMLASVVSVVIGIGMPIIQFTRHEHSLSSVTGVMLLPVVGPLVAAAAGGNIAMHLSPEHARFTICASYVMWGAGFTMSMLTLSMFYARLTIHKIPQAALTVTIFLPIGPLGQCNYALLRLSSALLQITRESGAAFAAPTQFSANDAHSMAAAVYGVSIAIGLMLWGIALVWLVIAVSLLIDMWWVSRLSFNLGWWGFTFPLGTFCSATNQLALELDSEAFRVLGSFFSAVEVVLWLGIASMTTYRAAQGEIFVSPCLTEAGGIPSKGEPVLVRKYDYVPRISKTRSESVSTMPARNGTVAGSSPS